MVYKLKSPGLVIPVLGSSIFGIEAELKDKLTIISKAGS
jgi:hypothetical protein